MTEEQKQAVLHNFKGALDYLRPIMEKEILEWQGVYDTMTRDIDRETYAPLRAQFMIPAMQVMDIIEDRRGRLTPLIKMIAYLEGTDAADMTPESIKAAGE